MTSRHLNHMVTTALGIFAMTIGISFTNVFPSYIYAIITSIVIVIVTIFLHMMGSVNKELYYVSIGTNMFATGLLVAGYYTYLEDFFVLDTVILVAGLSLLGSVLLSYIFSIQFAKNNKLILLIFVILLLFGSTISLYVTEQSLFHSALLFYSVLVSFQLIGYASVKDELMKHKSFLSFGVYLVVAFIVSLVITEGDSIAILDTNPSAVAGNKQKKEQ